MKVIVTGGSGLVGNALRHLKPEWIYLSSKDCNLVNFGEVNTLLSNYKPDVIIHLAANVGGLFKNQAKRLEMFNTNMIMNYNVLENAYRVGVKRVICCLSTCVFPDSLNRVLNEEDLHNGEPHYSNFGYAYAKRMMEVQCRLYNETPGYFYQCIIPTNIYGPYDNFNLEDSHVIPGLIHKAFLTKKGETFTIKGSGKPKRQFIFSLDLARMIILLLENDKKLPLIICSTRENDESTIIDVAKLIGSEFNIPESNIVPSQKDTKEDGQYIKTASPFKFLSLFPNFEFTSLDIGITLTSAWFKMNYPNIRI